MYFEELETDRWVELGPVVLAEEEIIAFSRRYDDLPVHPDPQFAAQTRFGRVISPGLLTYLTGWAEYLHQDFFGEQLVAGKGVQMEWHRPVFAGDELRGRAAVTALEPYSSRYGLARLTLNLYDREGQAVVTSEAQLVIQRKNPLKK